MKIKLAILEQDKAYLTRLVSAFGSKYADHFEIFSFTDPEIALGTLSPSKIDVLLAGDSFELDINALPKRCAFAYLVDSNDINMLNGQCAISKFQKADLLYKQILSIYSEKAGDITSLRSTDSGADVVVFCPVSGGVGCSTMAAACAVRFASQGKKTLYLNLETFGSAETFFSGAGQYTMSDIIFAVKSKKANLAMKLESCVRRDARGVCYYAPAGIALDMMEFGTEDRLHLIDELSAEYERIVLDMDFSVDRNALQIWERSHAVVLVGDGSAESNAKAKRVYDALTILDKNSDSRLTNRVAFLYNKVSSKDGHSAALPGVKVLGGAPKYAGAGVRQIVDQLASMGVFDNIF